MRDPELFSEANCWTAADATLADELVFFWRTRRDLAPDEVPAAFVHQAPVYNEEEVERVWSRLQAYPHNFELAAARGTLDLLNSDGTLRQGTALAPVRVKRFLHSGFTVNVGDVEDFLAGETLSDSFLQLLLMLTRSVWNPDSYVYPPWLVAQRKVSSTLRRFVPGGGSKVRGLPPVACFPYLHEKPRAWVLYVVRADPSCASKKKVTLFTPPDFASTSLKVQTAHLRAVFGAPACKFLAPGPTQDVAFFEHLVRTCFEASDGKAEARDFSGLKPLLRELAEDLLRLAQESATTDVDLFTAGSKAVKAFCAFLVATPPTVAASAPLPPVTRPRPADAGASDAPLLKRRRVFWLSTRGLRHGNGGSSC
jgi:hypothetical protein